MDRPRIHLLPFKPSTTCKRSGEHHLADSFSEVSSESSHYNAHQAGRHSSHLDPRQRAKLDYPPVYPKNRKDPLGKRVKAFWHDLSATFRTVFIGLMLFAVATSLDNTTATQFIPYATSDFHEHSALGIVLTAQAIVLAVESLIIGLFWAFIGSIVFYVGGYVLISFSTSIWVYMAGTLISTVGLAAFVALPSLTIIKYSARLGDNALLNSFLSSPYYVTGWIASFIVDGVISNLGWRWAYRLFCILVPISALPLLIALLRAERQWKFDSRKAPIEAENIPLANGPISLSGSTSVSGLFLSIAGHHPALSDHQVVVLEPELRSGAKKGPRSGREAPKVGGKRARVPRAKLDGMGLSVLAVGLGCLLCPLWVYLTLVGQGTFTWTSPVFYSLIAVGGVALLLFFIAEKFTTSPLFPSGLWRVRRVIITVATTWLNMTSFYVILAYQYSFIQVMYPAWSPLVQGFFAFSEPFTFTLVHLIASFPIASLVKAQTTLNGGFPGLMASAFLALASVRLPSTSSLPVKPDLPLCLVILSRRQINFSLWIRRLFMAQEQDALQCSTSRSQWPGLQQAMNAIGTAIATNLWQHFLPRYLQENLGALLSEADITAVFSSTEIAKSYPQDGEISIAIRTAYVGVMAILLYVALALSTLSFLLSFLMGKAYVAEKIDPRIKQRDRARAEDARQLTELESEEEEEHKKPRDVEPAETRRKLSMAQVAMGLGKRERMARREGRKYRRQYGEAGSSQEEESE
ncbi:hypothetical protein JCM11251_000211 [Rhodosporidiobolus azoricus]